MGDTMSVKEPKLPLRTARENAEALTFGLIGTAVIHIYASEQSLQSFVIFVYPVVPAGPVRKNYRE